MQRHLKGESTSLRVGCVGCERRRERRRGLEEPGGSVGAGGYGGAQRERLPFAPAQIRTHRQPGRRRGRPFHRLPQLVSCGGGEWRSSRRAHLGLAAEHRVRQCEGEGACRNLGRDLDGGEFGRERGRCDHPGVLLLEHELRSGRAPGCLPERDRKRRLALRHRRGRVCDARRDERALLLKLSAQLLVARLVLPNQGGEALDLGGRALETL